MPDEVTQPRPLRTQPSVIRKRAPKRSISQPWNGDNQVCSTISSENVTWIAGNDPLVAFCNGLTKSVHTYCGEEMAIIATRPSTNWSQRDAMALGTVRVSVADMTYSPVGVAWVDACRASAMPPCRHRQRAKRGSGRQLIPAVTEARVSVVLLSCERSEATSRSTRLLRSARNDRECVALQRF